MILSAFAALAIGLASCSRVPPLTNTSPSSEALARAVLSAIERDDTDALVKLALNEQEFRDHVWPELPASRPERNLPFSYVWGELHQKSQASLSGTRHQRAGKHYELVAVRHGEPATSYKTFRVHRQTTLVVRDAAGAELALRLLGSMLEKQGAWKVFSYVTD